MIVLNPISGLGDTLRFVATQFFKLDATGAAHYCSVFGYILNRYNNNISAVRAQSKNNSIEVLFRFSDAEKAGCFVAEFSTQLGSFLTNSHLRTMSDPCVVCWTAMARGSEHHAMHAYTCLNLGVDFR